MENWGTEGIKWLSSGHTSHGQNQDLNPGPAAPGFTSLRWATAGEIKNKIWLQENTEILPD